jgi:hypothetical protein
MSSGPASGRPLSIWLGLAIAGASITASVSFLVAEAATGSHGFPLDDSWIHVRFASNLAAGNGLAFNPGVPSTGSTAPLWSALLSVPVALGFDVLAGAKCLGILLAALTAMLAAAVTRALSGSARSAAVAGFATALSARLAWGAVSGMEVPLYTAATTLALLWFVQAPERGWAWGSAAGLATLARPEAGVLFPLFVASMFRHARPLDSTVRRSIGWATVAFAVLVGGAMAVNVVISDRPLPATFYAKTDGAGLLNALGRRDMTEVGRSIASRPLGTLNQLVRYGFDQSAILTLFVLPGLLALGGLSGSASRRGLPVALMLVASPLLVGARAPVSPYLMQEGRYVAHLLVIFFVVAAVGAAELAARTRHAWVIWSLATLAVARLLSQNVSFAPQYAAQVDNINRMHVAMGRWIADHTPADAAVAVNDIGAIGFFSDRRIIDLEGLVTPAVLPYREGRRYVQFVEQERPDLVVIFPEWYPEIVDRADLFPEIHRITVPRVTAAHDTMVVYATPWTRVPPTP